MNRTIVTSAMLALALAVASPARAGVGSKAAGELAEFIMKKFGKEVAEEGAERFGGRLAKALAQHGDDLASAVRKVGPKAISLADDAGGEAPKVIRLLTHYGDDAARVLSRPEGMALFTRYGDDAAKILMQHKGIAEPLIENLGKPAIEALGAVGPQAGRRMAMMADDLAAGGRASELLGVIAKHGDPAMEFLWRHKGVLAGGAALTAFLANPEPYLHGTADIARVGTEGANRLVETVADSTVKPAVVAAGNVAVEATSLLRQLLVVAAIGVAAVTGLGIKCGVVKRLPLGVGLKLAGKRIVAAVTRHK